MTIPGIGNLPAVMIYAWVGDISRHHLGQTDWELWHARREVNLRNLKPLARKAG